MGMVIYNGHGGSGWNTRKLTGFCDDNKNYLLLERVENGRSGRSLLEVKRWFLFIVLPENIEKIDKIYHNGINMAPIRPHG